jgi:starch synthase
LPEEPERPIIAIISRLVSQKGYDLIQQAARGILETGAFFIALGAGAKQYEDFLQSWHDQAPTRVGIYKGFAGEPLAHQIEAGADLFLMPSLYEPCGLNQMYSMRYGTVPVVRATGGLDDTSRISKQKQAPARVLSSDLIWQALCLKKYAKGYTFIISRKLGQGFKRMEWR